MPVMSNMTDSAGDLPVNIPPHIYYHLNNQHLARAHSPACAGMLVAFHPNKTVSQEA